MVCKVHGLKSLSNFDEFFLVDERKAIIACAIRCEKFDFDKMSEFIKNKMAKKVKPSRVRLLQMYGQHYWKYLDFDQLEKLWPKSCHKVENVHTLE